MKLTSEQIETIEETLVLKGGGLIVILIYLFLLYGILKQFYKHFQFEKKLSTSKP
jgi:hypothetical protein